MNRVTAAIADLHGNLEDSSMSLLRGHFAMTLIADLPDQASVVALADLLAPLRDEGLTVAVIEVPGEEAPPGGLPARLSVHGADRPGIVRGATDVVLRFAGNITGLSTRLGADLYVLTADVVFPPDTDLADVAELLQGRMSELGVHASLTADDEELL